MVCAIGFLIFGILGGCTNKLAGVEMLSSFEQILSPGKANLDGQIRDRRRGKLRLEVVKEGGSPDAQFWCQHNSTPNIFQNSMSWEYCDVMCSIPRVGMAWWVSMRRAALSPMTFLQIWWDDAVEGQIPEEVPHQRRHQP